MIEKTEIASPLRRAVWLAATVGAFKPAELLGKVTGDANLRRSLAAQLGEVCAEVGGSNAGLWSLAAGARRRAIIEMNEAGALNAIELPDFLREFSPRPDDAFGRHLREALTGKSSASPGSTEEFDERYAAYEFVGGNEVGADPKGARTAVGVLEQQAQRAAADEALTRTIGPNFVGRLRELSALELFARDAKVVDEKFQNSIEAVDGAMPAVYVSGVGGAGKSALIAKLTQTLRKEDSGLNATILIDFDRPTFAGLNPIVLTQEVLRQLEQCMPEAAAGLIELSESLLADFSYNEIASGNAISSYAMFERAMYNVTEELRVMVRLMGLANRPIVIILDTFEEVLTLGEGFVWRVYRWLRDLYLEAGLPLRLIVSGRATPQEVVPDGSSPEIDPRELRPNFWGAIEIGDLESEDALTVLEKGGVNRSIAVLLTSQFGANPLVLRMLNDYAKQKGIESVLELLADEKGREQYQTQVAQRLLYSRILGRIRDDAALRALASPGLVVRVVTPGIIEHVLAEPCGLIEVDGPRAQELFRKLERQVWLVTSSGKSSLRHRRDIRALMFPLATEEGGGRTREELSEIADQIHRRALAYHRSDKRDPALTEEEHREEALYHELFVYPAKALSSPDSGLLKKLANDLSDFPLATRARLKLDLKLGKALTPDELEAIGENEAADYRARQMAQEISVTGGTVPPGSARETGRPSSPRPGVPAPTKPKKKQRSAPLLSLSNSNPAQIIDAYARADFERVAETAPILLTRFFSAANSDKRSANLERDMSDHLTWLIAMSTLAIPVSKRDDQFVALAEQLCRSLLKDWHALAKLRLEDHSGFTLAHYLTAVAILLYRGRRLERHAIQCVQKFGGVRGLGNHQRADLRTTGALRIFQMFALASPGGGYAFHAKAVNADRLQFFAHLLDPKVIGRHDAMIARTQQAWARSNLALDVVHRHVDRLAPIAQHTLRSPALSTAERTLLNESLDLYDWSHPHQPPGNKSFRQKWTLPWVALRGMSSDLQAPMLAAIRERMQFPSSARRQMLQGLNKCSGVWPIDFSPQEIGDRKLGDTTLASIVHFADRFGLVPVLFEKAAANSLSARVGAVYSTLQKMLAQVVEPAVKQSVPAQRVAAQKKAAKVKQPPKAKKPATAKKSKKPRKSKKAKPVVVMKAQAR